MPGAGQLNTLITIQKPTQTTDANTGEVLETWSDYHRRLPSMKEEATARSTRRGFQVEEGVKALFTMPYIEDLSPHWRVKEIKKNGDDTIFQIISVVEERFGSRRWSILQCADVK